MIIAGYASVFNVKDLQNDVMLSGAFDEIWKYSKNIKVLWQHKASMEIGRVMSIYQDGYGLFVKCEISDYSTNCNNVITKIKNGTSSLSIGYKILSSYKDAETGVNYLSKVSLIEVSVVSFAANPLAKINLIW